MALSTSATAASAKQMYGTDFTDPVIDMYYKCWFDRGIKERNTENHHTILMDAAEKHEEADVFMILLMAKRSMKKAEFHDYVNYSTPALDDNDGNMTALHSAVLNREIGTVFKEREATPAIVQMLLENGANVECESSVLHEPFSFTWERVRPIHMAAKHCSLKTVELLIQHGADVCSTSEFGGTPLHFAAPQGNKHVAQCLLEHGANVHAVASSFLLESPNDLDHACHDLAPIHVALRHGSLHFARLLLNYGADIHSNPRGLTRLGLAVRSGSAEMVQMLIDNGADINEECLEGMSPAYLATTDSIRAGRILPFLHSLGANINAPNRAKQNFTPLHHAVHDIYVSTYIDHDLELVKTLLSLGADINARDTYGRTPLICAAASECGHKIMKDIFCDLLAYGADVDARDQEQRTALHHIAAGDELEREYLHDLAKYLIESGANVAPVDAFGHTPLDIAVAFGHEAVADLFRAQNSND